MLRILRAASLLIGVLLLLMTGFLAQARQGETPLYLMAIRRSYLNNTRVDWALLNPYTGREEPFAVGHAGVEFLGWAADGGLIFLAYDGQELPTLYRADTPDAIADPLLSRISSSEVWWSPNREWVVVEQAGLRGVSLVSVRTDGGGDYTLTVGVLATPSFAEPAVFSPDGLAVAFIMRRSDGFYDTYMARLDGTEIQNLTPDMANGGAPAAWLPEGLIISSNAQLQWADLTTHTLRPVTDGKATANETLAGWQPGRLAIVIEHAAARRMEWRDIPAATVLWSQADFSGYLFSPDVQWLMLREWVGWRLIETTTGESRFLEFPFDVTTGIPVWSPDSQTLAFSHFDALSGRSQIWRLEVAGGKFEKIWEGRDTIFDIFWSPDSRKIIAYTTSSAGTGFMWMNPDGTDAARLPYQSGQRDFAVWSPPISLAWQGEMLLGGGALLCATGVLSRRKRPL